MWGMALFTATSKLDYFGVNNTKIEIFSFTHKKL
jgi:hypothetical protein